MPPAQSFPRTFRIDGQYRRSCHYLVAGSWACIGLLIIQRLWFGQPLDAGIVPLALLFGIVPVMLWVLVSTYRLRLDEWGLSRRRLGIWTRWPWEAFIEGKVSIDRQFFIQESRPIWDRSITTAFLPAADSAFVQEIVESIAPEECRLEGRRLKLKLGEVTEATLGLVVARKLRVTASGCELLGPSGKSRPWDDVTEFRLEGATEGKHNIYRLKITPREGEPLRGTLNRVELPGVSLVPHMTGHDEWVVHLQSLVPERYWKYLRTWGEVRSIEEGEFRRVRWNKQIESMRSIQRMGLAFTLLLAAIFVRKVINGWNNPFLPLGWKLVVVGCLAVLIVKPAVLICFLALTMQRRLRERLAENERDLAALSEQTSLRNHAVNIHRGQVTNQAVAETFGLAHRPLA